MILLSSDNGHYFVMAAFCDLEIATIRIVVKLESIGDGDAWALVCPGVIDLELLFKIPNPT